MPSFKAIVGTLFGLLIAAIFVLGLISFRYNEQAIDSSFWVNHAQRVIDVADQISSSFKDLQIESNAIYMKRDSSRSTRYALARMQISSLLEEIKDLTKDNAVHRPEVDSLTRLVPKIIAFTDSAPRLSNLDHTSQDIYNRFNAANEFRDQINALLGRIKKREARLLQTRETENSQSIASFNEAFVLLLVGITVLVIVAFFSIRYNFNKLLKIDIQLRLAQDKTEKALATEIEINKLKSNFVALASHEFRTPLTTILSSASLLENYSAGEHQVKASKHIARIKSSVNSLTSILNEFLSLTKIEEGKTTPNIERLDLKLYMEDCIANLRNFARPGQTIVYTHEGLTDVETDPVLIGNIINNLVTNAIKYSPENTSIDVSSHVNGVIRLSVQDRGIGIPEEDQKHLFERFYRASNAGTVHGTGLGLHIMKHYVDMLHGTVKVTSEVSKGTSIEIEFGSVNAKPNSKTETA